MEDLFRSQGGAVGFVAILLVGGFVFSLVFYRRMRASRARYARQAAQHGLRYFPEDPFGLERLTMPLFEEADTVQFANLLIGDWDGLPFKAVEVNWAKERGGVVGDITEAVADVGKWTDEREYSVIVVELDLRLQMPWVVVTPRSLLSKAKSVVGLGGVRFEHGGEFNSVYEVRSQNARFAHDLVSPGMMNYLLQRRRVPWACPRCGRTHVFMPLDGVRFEVQGSQLLVAMPRVKSNVIMNDVYPLFAAAKGFVEQIPHQVWSHFGAVAVGGEWR